MKTQVQSAGVTVPAKFSNGLTMPPGVVLTKTSMSIPEDVPPTKVRAVRNARVLMRGLSQLCKPAPKSPLTTEEWDFHLCPADELAPCLLYECVRESESAKKVIASARAAVREDSSLLELDYEIWHVRWKLPYIPVLFGLFRIFGERLNTPWMSLPPEVRAKWREDKYIVMSVESWSMRPPVRSENPALLRNPCDPRRFDRSFDLTAEDDPSRVVRSVHCIQLDWTYSNKVLLAGFQEWLGGKRPPNAPWTDERLPRSLRAELSALGAYRLQKTLTWVEAAQLTRNVDQQLFSEHSAWILARRSTEQLLKRLEARRWVLGD